MLNAKRRFFSWSPLLKPLFAWWEGRLRLWQDPGCVLCLQHPAPTGEAFCTQCTESLALKACPPQQELNSKALLYTAAPYTPALKRLLYRYKFYRRPGTRWALRALYARNLKPLLEATEGHSLEPSSASATTWLSVIPSHTPQQAAHLQAVLEPLCFGQGTCLKSLSFKGRLFDWARPTQPQHTLKRKTQRWANLHQALKLSPQAEATLEALRFKRSTSPKETSPSLHIILADDIYTTGATLKEALRVLAPWQAQGLVKVTCLVLYKAPLQVLAPPHHSLEPSESPIASQGTSVGGALFQSLPLKTVRLSMKPFKPVEDSPSTP